jgi:hypothetical protein
VYNPGAKSMFPVSSELITGRTDAVLIDAQFQRNDAQALVQKIKASGKKLTTVYISHSDPDYYFGLDVIQAAFPEAKIVATPQTVAAIQASKDGKLAHWGPILKDNAPKAVVVPEAARRRQPRARGPEDPDRRARRAHARAQLRVDSLAQRPWSAVSRSRPTSTCGWPTRKRLHRAATGSRRWAASKRCTRRPWCPATTCRMPTAAAPYSLASVKFTRSYLQAFETEAKKAKDSAALVAAMKKRYPKLQDASSLELERQGHQGRNEVAAVTSTSDTATLHYIFDPMCGWCYAAAPLVDAARSVPGLKVEFHGGGMMTGANRRAITPQWREYVMPHDRRIAELTGQPFSEAYFEGLAARHRAR